MATLPAKPAMKERILETADRLFYLQGIRAVGVDTIAAEIGISKRTLYNHFPSKDALISAYLARRFVAPRASDKSPVEQILGTFDSLERRFAAKDFRGCPFVNAVAELGCEDQSVRRIAVEFKESRRLWFRDLLVQLGVTEAEALATQLALLGRRLHRAGSRSQRSVDGTGGQGSRDGAAQECRGEGGRNSTTREKAPAFPGDLKPKSPIVRSRNHTPWPFAEAMW